MTENEVLNGFAGGGPNHLKSLLDNASLPAAEELRDCITAKLADMRNRYAKEEMDAVMWMLTCGGLTLMAFSSARESS